MVATNDCGPLRHRSGTPRDLLIGITLALTDGRLVKAGGHVVKNVAGYDLGRLVSGSFGTLAGIVDATFKLMPIPQASATLVGELCRPRGAGARCRRDGRQPARAGGVRRPRRRRRRGPRSDGPYPLLIKFASSPASTEEQVNHASALLTGEVSVVAGEAEAALWREQIAAPWRAEAGRALSDAPAVIRMSWLPSRLADVIALVRGQVMSGRVMGTGLVRLDGDPCRPRARSSSVCAPATRFATWSSCGRFGGVEDTGRRLGAARVGGLGDTRAEADVRPGRNSQRRPGADLTSAMQQADLGVDSRRWAISRRHPQ